MKRRFFLPILMIIILCHTVSLAEKVTIGPGIVFDDSVWGEISTRYVQRFGCKTIRDIVPAAKRARYAALSYKEVIEYFEQNHDEEKKSTVEYIVQQAMENGMIQINGGVAGTYINVSFSDNDGNCITLFTCPAKHKLMYDYEIGMGEDGTLLNPLKIDIAQFKKYYEMEPNEILGSLD